MSIKSADRDERIKAFLKELQSNDFRLLDGSGGKDLDAGIGEWGEVCLYTDTCWVCLGDDGVQYYTAPKGEKSVYVFDKEDFHRFFKDVDATTPLYSVMVELDGIAYPDNM